MASGKGAGDLQMAIAKVERDLLEHLDDEEQILEPALEADEAAGSLRARLLEAEHAHQRAVLSILSTPMAWPADKVLAERTLEFCADLLGDIDFEDRELLGPCMPAARA